MQYFFYTLIIPFLYLNYKIIASDLKYKKIPNKYLWYLLLIIPFYYIYIFFSFPDINYLLFIWQIFLTFIISFILYSFWIWAAWDAKYLLVLALFIPNIWIISFIWNIALLTIVYLLWYFIWFYFWKCLFYKWYAKSLWWNIKQDLNEKWLVYKWNKWWKTFFIILKWIVVFLIIFVSIRLSRIYLFNEVFSWEANGWQIIQELFEKYSIYLIILFILIFIWWLYLFRLWINKLKNYIWNKLKLNLTLVWNIFLSILFVLLISFIIYEYIINPNEISNLLFKVFTLYLGLYILFKVLFYSYKITFGIAEMEYINIKDLKEGEIVDKEYLVKMFWSQEVFLSNLNNKKEKLILPALPIEYFQNIYNPIDQKTLNKLKQVYKTVNSFHLKSNKWFTKIETIKVLKTFAFWWYLFSWFLIGYIFEDEIIKYLLFNIIEIIKS